MSLNEKFLEIRSSVNYLQKKKNGEAKYSFVSSTDVVAPIREKMCELGLLLLPNLKNHTMTKIFEGEKSTTILTELDIEYTWIDVESGESLIVSWYGQGVDISGEKGVGKALTYAEKYFLLKFFNIPSDNDDPDTFENKKKKTGAKKTTPTEPKQPASTKFINMEQKEVLKKNLTPKKFAEVMNACGGRLTEDKYWQLLQENEGWDNG